MESLQGPGHSIRQSMDQHRPSGQGRASMGLDYVILEAWSQGFLVGGLGLLIMITLANIRKGVLLHKLILLELLFSLGHGTFVIFPDPTYGWYLSSTASVPIKLFVSQLGSALFIGTVILVTPYWVAEMYLNSAYFNGLGNDSFTFTRPWEVVVRDGWWIFTACWLTYSIKTGYNVTLVELVKISSRFGILLLCMILSIVFMFVDVAVTVGHVFKDKGVNPFWKPYIIFKCASDVIFLDDFKQVVDRLVMHTVAMNTFPDGSGMRPRQSVQPAALRDIDLETSH
ncbi:hypothetical protein KXV52_003612 [Aspergillus fumigatus]|nr:hypothetical protein KXV66_008183 [Aspergillus fumigatus]KAH3364389.1 hypothetical protein KXV52_003612 [Aspergillus fumigatus]KAH3398430.1 hypothetical protein KXV40_005749 [Aspergillus fumigatus]